MIVIDWSMANTPKTNLIDPGAEEANRALKEALARDEIDKAFRRYGPINHRAGLVVPEPLTA